MTSTATLSDFSGSSIFKTPEFQVPACIKEKSPTAPAEESFRVACARPGSGISDAHLKTTLVLENEVRKLEKLFDEHQKWQRDDNTSNTAAFRSACTAAFVEDVNLKTGLALSAEVKRIKQQRQGLYDQYLIWRDASKRDLRSEKRISDAASTIVCASTAATAEEDRDESMPGTDSTGPSPLITFPASNRYQNDVAEKCIRNMTTHGDPMTAQRGWV